MRVEVEQVEGRRFLVRARDVELIVDDTLEAGGPGDGFRPSELLMAALATCMAGTMLNFARNQGIAVDNIGMVLEEEAADHPDRIDRIAISMVVEAETTERRAESLRRVASGCKIHNTLQRSTELALDFTVQP